MESLCWASQIAEYLDPSAIKRVEADGALPMATIVESTGSLDCVAVCSFNSLTVHNMKFICNLQVNN